MARNFVGCCSEIPVIIAAVIPLTGFAALVTGCLRQGLRILFQQFVQRFLHTTANQFLDFPLDNFLFQLYNFLRHSLLSSFRMVCGNLILPESSNYVSSFLRNLLYLIVYLSFAASRIDGKRQP